MQTTTTAAKDFRAAPLNTAKACDICYIPALHESVKEALNIVGEYRAHNVFALHADYCERNDWNSKGRFAIAHPVAREDWHTIEAGTIILYVAKWLPSEEEAREGSLPCYTTHVGPLALFDNKRGVLYAASWHTTEGDNGPDDYEANSIYEMHVVERFIEVA
jgi:hypothetical protein